MKHGEFQKQVKEQLESQAAFVISISGHRMQKNGLPDLDITHRKWKGRIEIKIEKDPVRPLQRIQAAKLELRGVPVYVLRCKEYTYCHSMYATEQRFGIKDCGLTLENFQGEVIETINDLSSLLGVLVSREEFKERNGG